MINYYGVQAAIRDLLAADTTLQGQVKAGSFLIEAMERDINYMIMPLINVRLDEGNVELRSIPNGYHIACQFKIEVYTYHLNDFKTAARLRDDILKRVMTVLQTASNFHADADSSLIAPELSFGAGTPEQGGGHIALSTVTFVTMIHVNAT